MAYQLADSSRLRELNVKELAGRVKLLSEPNANCRMQNAKCRMEYAECKVQIYFLLDLAVTIDLVKILINSSAS